MKYTLPYFGEINLNALEEYYVQEITLDGQPISLDLNFDEVTIKKTGISVLENHLIKLPDIIALAKQALAADFESGTEVKFYLDHHLEEVSSTDLADLLKDTPPGLTNEQKLFTKFYLKRIGFYPEDNTNFAVLDFTIGPNVTQYLLVVNVTSKMQVDSITMES